jgi:hypothetical protein
MSVPARGCGLGPSRRQPETPGAQHDAHQVMAKKEPRVRADPDSWRLLVCLADEPLSPVRTSGVFVVDLVRVGAEAGAARRVAESTKRMAPPGASRQLVS